MTALAEPGNHPSIGSRESRVYPYNIPIYESLGVSRDTLLVALETPVYEIDQSPSNNLTLTEIMSAPEIRMLEPPYLYVMPTRSELVQMAIPSVASTS